MPRPVTFVTAAAMRVVVVVIRILQNFGTWTCGNPDCDKKIRKDVQERVIAKRISKGDKDTEPPVPNAFLCFDCHSKHATGTEIKILDGSVKRRPAYQQKGNSNGTNARANHVDVSSLDRTSKEYVDAVA